LTPTKALKASAALRMRTPADDVAWIARYRAATEQLKSKESSVQADERAGEDVGAGEAATSTRDAGQADVVETRNVEETPRDAGREEELPEL
jgi:hypothetical protein